MERSHYNLLGELDSYTNRRGHVIGFTRDSAGHITQQSFADGSHLDYTFDARDRLLSMTDETGTTTFTYDTKDRLTKAAYPGDRLLQFSYDDGGRRTQSVDQDGFTVNYRYDAVGRLAELEDVTGASIVLYIYNATGQLIRQENGNGTFTTYIYDAAGQLLDLTNHAPDGSAQSRFIYTYDSLGRRIAMETLDGDWTYEYDATGQLIHAALDSTNASIPDQDLSYSYDGLGNRIKVIENGGTTNYATNNLNQYTTVASAVLTYDADGNLIRKVDGASVSTYTYNDQNRLAGVTTPQGTWAYEYNALGHRMATLHNGVRTDYLVDPMKFGSTVGIFDLQSGTDAKLVYGKGLVGQFGESLADTTFYNFDGTGNTAATIGASGDVITVQSYRSFGTALQGAFGTTSQYAFAGKFGVSRDGSGLDQMGTRYYDSGTGGFLSNNPNGLAVGSLNPRTYAGNNPNSTVSPTGTENKSFIQRFIDKLNPYASLDEYVNSNGERGAIDDKANNLGRLLQQTGEAALFLQDKLPPSDGAGLLKRLGQELGGLLFGPDAGSHTNSGSIPYFVAASRDPNALIGPSGIGPQNYISLNIALPYRIDFENDTTATAPAQFVTISQQLDSDLDWDTFELKDFGFGDYLITISEGSRHFQTTIGVEIEGDVFQVAVELGIISETGMVFAVFQSLDPATDLPPGILTGFLHPEDGTGRGMGHINYVVKARPDATTGTELNGVALITFDNNESIATNQIDPHDPTRGTNPALEARNTIDADVPVSAITTASGTQGSRLIQLNWQGTDVGSGVAGYDIFVSDNGGAFTLAQSNISGTTTTYIGQSGHTYGFLRCNRFLDHFCLAVFEEIRLELSWGKIAQGGMLSAGVVVSFDVGEEFDIGVGLVDKAAALKHLGFDGADDAFGPRVVVGIGSGGHALAHTGLLEQSAKSAAAVLASTVAVEDCVFQSRAGAEGLAQSIDDELRAQVICQCPADDFARAEVDDDGQVEPALRGGDKGYVAREHLIYLRGQRRIEQKIWRGTIGPAIAGFGHEVLWRDGA